MSKKNKDMIAFLEERIDRKRMIHSRNTAKEAVRLAKKYGEDPKKAYTAGLLHDVAKGHCRFGLRKLAKEYDVSIDEFEVRNPELSHGKLGAIMVRKHLGITDKDILAAIRWHTTGRAEMSMLEKIVYIADIIEPDRDFTGIRKVRKLADKDIDEAMIVALEHVMKFVHSKGFALHPKSIEAYQYFIKQGGKKIT